MGGRCTQTDKTATALTLGGVVFDLLRCLHQHLLAGDVHRLGCLSLEDV
jgi:hypothetical protein